MADRSDTREAHGRTVLDALAEALAREDVLEARVAALEAERATLREALQSVIDCEDFSAKRAFTMKMIARAALVSGEDNSGP